MVELVSMFNQYLFTIYESIEAYAPETPNTTSKMVWNKTPINWIQIQNHKAGPEYDVTHKK